MSACPLPSRLVRQPEGVRSARQANSGGSAATCSAEWLRKAGDEGRKAVDAYRAMWAEHRIRTLNGPCMAASGFLALAQHDAPSGAAGHQSGSQHAVALFGQDENAIRGAGHPHGRRRRHRYRVPAEGGARGRVPTTRSPSGRCGNSSATSTIPISVSPCRSHRRHAVSSPRLGGARRQSGRGIAHLRRARAAPAHGAARGRRACGANTSRSSSRVIASLGASARSADSCMRSTAIRIAIKRWLLMHEGYRFGA